MTPESKLRYLAQMDATLQGYLLGMPGGQFRWYDTALPLGVIEYGPCVTVLRVSQTSLYALGAGRSTSAWPRFQIDVLSVNPEQARAIAHYMETTFLQYANLSVAGLFACPATAFYECPATTLFPAQNIVLNNRGTRLFQVVPPIYRVTLDVRCYNVENF